jgi:biopolymer transport protein ExbB
MKTNNFLLLIFLAAIIQVASVLPAHAQQAAPGASPAATQNQNLWEKVCEGGIVMIPIAACSILTLYLVIDGTLRTSAKSVLPAQQVQSLKDLFRAGDYVNAYEFCKTNPSPFTNVARVAISLLGEGKIPVEEGVQAEMAREDSKIQTRLSYLSVIGVCTPMIGLLGTVTGMIRAFQTLGASGIGDPSSLAAAIGQVLIATASGLFIAIPAFGCFYFLRNRAVKVMHDMEDVLTQLFRKMPYDLVAGVQIGGESLYAAAPNWIASSPEEADGAEMQAV